MRVVTGERKLPVTAREASAGECGVKDQVSRLQQLRIFLVSGRVKGL